MVKLDRETGLVWFESNGVDKSTVVVHNKNIAYFTSSGSGDLHWFTLHIPQPPSEITFSYKAAKDRDSDLDQLLTTLGMENHFKPAVVL